jgi:hypothetical protein
MYLPILNKKHQKLRNNNADLSCDQKTTTGAYTMTGETSGYLQTGLPFGKHLLGLSLDFDKRYATTTGRVWQDTREYG